MSMPKDKKIARSPFLPGWEALWWAGLGMSGLDWTVDNSDCSIFSYKSMPKVDSGRALMYLKLLWSFWVGRTAVSSVWKGRSGCSWGRWWARGYSVNLAGVFHTWRRFKLCLCWFLLNQICNERNLVLNDLLPKSGFWAFWSGTGFSLEIQVESLFDYELVYVNVHICRTFVWLSDEILL